MFENSVESIMNLQKNTSQFIIDLMSIFTHLGGGPMTSIVVLMMFLDLQSRWRVVYYSLMTTVIVSAIVILKMLYAQDRPNWYDISITVGYFDCQLEYGNPSGHALEAAAFSFTVYLDSLLSMSNRSKRKYLVCYSLMWLPFPVVYTYAMGFSRVVIGVHSWNQVIFGWLLGLWIAIFLTCCIRA